MSNPNYTAVLFIIDASGSMDHHRKPLQKALHLMLEQQARKLAGFLTVDVGYFDTSPWGGIENADPLTVDLGMFAQGGTQLYDSTHVILERFEKRINAMPEREKPGHVVVIIVTDGDSTEAQTGPGASVGTKIKGLRDRGWDFAFLGADSTSFDRVRAKLQLPTDCGVYHPFDKNGIQKAADELGEFISMSRAGEKAHF